MRSMLPPAIRRPRPHLALPLAATLLLSGCQLIQPPPASAILPEQGMQTLRGLAQPVTVHRDPRDVPLIESASLHDGLFTLGYLHGRDRLAQMIRLRLLADGRLAELDGAPALPLDRLLRALDLRHGAAELLRSASPQMRQILDVYARGVNAALFAQRRALPAELAGLQPAPAYWQAEDSALLFYLLDLALSGNLEDELAALWLAPRVDQRLLATLLGDGPEQPLDTEELALLQGPVQPPSAALLRELLYTLRRFDQQAPGVHSSLQVAVHASRSRGGRSLLAMDSRHSSTQAPWYAVQLKTPRYQVAGAGLPGLPLLLQGFNGQLTWSLGSIRADTQDLAIESLRRRGAGFEYRHQDGSWQTLQARPATFFIRGQRPQRHPLYASANGPLLHDPHGQPSALALRRPALNGDRSLDALFALSRAPSLEQAHDAARAVRTPAVHLLYADAGSIAWQVAGRYPNRLSGRGLLPVPGWQPQRAWDGYADSMLHPYDQDPARGALVLAGQRSVAPGYGVQMAAAWQTAQVAEQLEQRLAKGAVEAGSLARWLAQHPAPRHTLLERLSQPQSLQHLPAAQAESLRQTLAALDLPPRPEAASGLRWRVDFSQQEPLKLRLWPAQREADTRPPRTASAPLAPLTRRAQEPARAEAVLRLLPAAR